MHQPFMSNPLLSSCPLPHFTYRATENRIILCRVNIYLYLCRGSNSQPNTHKYEYNIDTTPHDTRSSFLDTARVSIHPRINQSIQVIPVYNQTVHCQRQKHPLDIKSTRFSDMVTRVQSLQLSGSTSWQ